MIQQKILMVRYLSSGLQKLMVRYLSSALQNCRSCSPLSLSPENAARLSIYLKKRFFLVAKFKFED